jgi:hypothetical protein
MLLPKASKIAAALIAVAATLGLVVQFVVSFDQLGSPTATLWVLLGYFTILTNVLVVVVFFAIAFTGLERCPGYVVAGTTLSIVLVGVIYYVLLHGLSELSGGSQVANILLHLVTPVAAPLYWLSMAVKGRLRWSDPLLWAVYPLAYFFYALVRGDLTGKYPYPFIDVLQLGWPRTLINACVIAVAYMAAGYVMVAIDRGLGRKSDLA